MVLSAVMTDPKYVRSLRDWHCSSEPEHALKRDTVVWGFDVIVLVEFAELLGVPTDSAAVSCAKEALMVDDAEADDARMLEDAADNDVELDADEEVIEVIPSAVRRESWATILID